MDKKFLFLASADEAWLSQHRQRFLSEFDLNVFRNLEELQTALNDRQPDLLLLDTRLPNGDAFEMHKSIRDDFMTSDVYQILLCSEEELARPDFVADDFLVLPVAEAALWQKLSLFKKSLVTKAAVADQLRYAQNVAITAMSSMGELGVVMQFLSHSFECTAPQAVAVLAAGTVRQYDLAGVVQLRWDGDGHIAKTDDTLPTEEDTSFIDQMRTLGRIMELGQRLIVNYDHCSILITNMPDDPERCGRIRDNIATLAEGVEARVRALLVEQDNVLKQQGIRYAVNGIRESVHDLHRRQVQDSASSQALVNKVIDDFEDAFVHTGLMPEVENALIGQLVTLRQKITEVVGRPGEVHAKLETVVNSLETLAGEVGL